MRVALLSWEYPPRITGGTAAHVAGLGRSLARAGHDVVVMTIAGSRAPERDETVDGVRVLRADIGLPWIPVEDRIAYVAAGNHQMVKLRRMLADWRPDVVHAHDWGAAWAADSLADLGGVPLVATFHGTERGRHGGDIPAGDSAEVHSIESWMAHRADGLICLSEFMRREVIDDFELDPARVAKIPNGISIEQWSPPDHEPPPRERLVVAWGRVMYEKGFPLLAAAIARLRHRIPGLRCVIAGRGPYLAELQLQIDLEAVGDLVHLAGFVADDDLRDLLHRAGCVAIPSLYEPYGVVALEAMAAGAPIVAARTGGLAELVGVSGAGLLFEPGSADALAEAIERVFTEEPLSGEMRLAATELLRQRYSWGAIGRATVEAYTRAGA